MRKLLLSILPLLASLFISCGTPGTADRESITVYAAASLTDAVAELAAGFSEATGIGVETNLASSGMLAKQIIAGAPADVFLSANTAWMSEVVKAGRARAEEVIDFAGNRLVVITKEDAALDIKTFEDLVSQDIYVIAIGDPSHVPAGQYAVEAMKADGLYDRIADKLVPAIDVRAVLAYVANHEADAGIVFRTDAKVVEGIYIAAEVPAELHQPIVYQAAVTAESDGAAGRRFLEYIASEEGRAILEKYGFIIPPR
jgi:molybdate transport system substrate-binding protein